MNPHNMDEETWTLDLLSQQLQAASQYAHLYKRKKDSETLEKLALAREGLYATVRAIDHHTIVYEAVKGLLAWEDDDWLDMRKYSQQMTYLTNIKQGRKEIRASQSHSS